MNRNRRRLLGVLVLALVVIGFALFHDAIIETAIPSLGRLAGYDVRYGSFHLTGNRLHATDVDVRNLHGEPVATIGVLDVGFSLRDLLPGGRRLFGLTSLDVVRPHLILIHHKDGTYNVALPHGSAKSSGISAPLDLTVHVSDGSAEIRDDERLYRETRHLSVEGLTVDGTFRPAAPSRYEVRLAVVEAGRRYPVSGHGFIDEARGIENNRFRAAEVPIGPLVDYALNTATVHITRGSLVDLDARYFGIPNGHGTMVRHLGVAGRIVNFTLALGFLTRPLRDGTGEVFAYDNGLMLPHLTGTIAGVPIVAAGGLYNFAEPTFRLGIAGAGELARLVTLSSSAAKLPLSGPVRFGVLVEGNAAAPLTFAHFASPRVTYGAFPLDGPRGLVAIDGTDTLVLRAEAGYAGAAVVARGRITARRHTDIDILANLTAPARNFPYVDTLLPGMTIAASAVATGTDAKIATAGEIDGVTSEQQLAGIFAVDERGVGTVGPLTLTGPAGESLLAAASLDRPHGGGEALLSARSLRVTNTRVTGLPGVQLPPLPPFALALDADAGATLAGKRAAGAGTLAVHDATLRGVPLGDLTARATVADGPRVALSGRYRGSLGRLAALAGTPGAGSIDLAFGALSDGTRTTAQIADAHFEDASIAGVAVNAIAATVGVRGRALDVYAARAGLGPGDVVASGSFGDGGTLALSTGLLDLRALAAVARTPVRAGTVTALASVGGTLAAPVVDAGVVATGVRVRNVVANGSTSLGFAGSRLAIRGGVGGIGDVVGTLDGTVGGLVLGAIRPQLDLTARADAVDIASLAKLVKTPLKYPTGSVDAAVHVRGAARDPGVSGRIAIPEGSINGLDYRDVAVAFAGDAGGVRASGGTVTVGTSRIGFDAALARTTQRVSIFSRALDLSDFNDYFDAADTLAGRGAFDLAVTNTPAHVAARADVALAGVQVKRIALGTTRAVLSTQGRSLLASARVGGASGTVAVAGTLTLPPDRPLRDPLRRSRVALIARADRIDLAQWLPVFDIRAPVAGFVSADARAAGTFPDIGARANARLDQGRFGRVPVDVAALTATATRGRITVASAVLDVPDLTTTLSGNAGLHPRDPIDLTLHARTADVGALAKTVQAQTYDVSGAVDATVRVQGTALRPRAALVVDGTALRYEKYTVPHAHLETDLTDLATNERSGRIDLRDTVLDLQRGRITASGSAPFSIAQGPALGPARAPIALALGVEGLDLGQFGALLPKNTKLGGLVDGHVGLTGTVAEPGTTGALSIASLSYLGPQEVQKITNGTAVLTFANRTATLSAAHVDAGGGTIDATGDATLGDLSNPARSATYVASAVFNHPLLQLPNLFRGRLDGTIAVTKVRRAPITVTGDITATSARIPYTALLPSGTAATPAPGPTARPIVLALGVTAGRDVRVQSGPVDIGAQGHVDVTGTLTAPKASGKFVATGGSINFYRDFRLQNGVVAFSPDNGVTPSVDANATTTVPSPPTDVMLGVTGLATSLNVDLTSSPAYSKEQILGLLIGLNSFGAVSGVAAGQGGPAPTAGSLATGIATGEISTLFTRNLLEPLSSSVGSAIGLNNLGVNYTPGGGVDLSARKQIVKHVDAVFAETFGYPQRQSYGLEYAPNDATAAQITVFQQPAANQFEIAPQALQSSNFSVTGAEPQRGQNGFSFSLQRKFP